MEDIFIGKMFLNLMLHPRIQPYAGIDLTPYFGDDFSELEGFSMIGWERWKQCTMGFKPSPYQTIQGILMAEEVIRGVPEEPRNFFRWDIVELNLLGAPTYKPFRPWVTINFYYPTEPWHVAFSSIWMMSGPPGDHT